MQVVDAAGVVEVPFLLQVGLDLVVAEGGYQGGGNANQNSGHGAHVKVRSAADCDASSLK